MTLRAQQTVCAIIVAAFAVGVFQTIKILLAVSVFNGGQAWYSWYGAIQLAPLVVFAALWLTARGSLWERAYQALVLSTAALFAGMAFSTFFFSFLSRFLIVTSTSSVYIYDFIAILLPQFIFAAVYAVLLQRQKSIKKTLALSYSTLVFSAVVCIGVSAIDTIAQVAMQYPSNQNLSAYVESFIWLFGVLLLGAALVFLERRRGVKKPFRVSVFVTTFGVVAVYNAVYLVSLISGIRMVQWLAAFFIMVAAVGGLFAFRWLYRTIRILE